MRAKGRLPVLSAVGLTGILVVPKLLWGHCVLHLLGISALLGFDPLHALWLGIAKRFA